MPSPKRREFPNTVDIVTDVVKLKFPSSESFHKLFRISNFGKLLDCTSELRDRSVRVEGFSWSVRLTFKVIVDYLDAEERRTKVSRLVIFEKEINLPPGADIRQRPVAEVSNITCDAQVLLGPTLRTSVEATTQFHLVVKGLLREEITVYTPEESH